MKKLIYIPLDERPCNRDFPLFLSKIAKDIELVLPPFELFGNKKSPANLQGLWEFLLESEADGYIISLDMLVYGGIIPSRLHYFSNEECLKRLEQLRQLKGKAIYAFTLLMRCPRYSSADEEPDYYEEFGQEIFKSGYISHKNELGIASKEELLELTEVENKLPKSHLNDYLSRRAINLEVNKKAIEFVAEGIIDFMIIPQDDSAPYGYTAKDQQEVRSFIFDKGVALQTYMYPGADEVGCTLLARMVNHWKGATPKIYPKYASNAGMGIIPLYEDRPLHESVKYHIIAVGGIVAESQADADILFCINSPGKYMREAVDQNKACLENDVGSNLIELVEYCSHSLDNTDKAVIIGDIAYANGSDLKLINMLRQKGILYRLNGYAGWNTSSNTLGTCLCQGVLTHIYGKGQEHLNFLALRYVEDAGYCSFVRALVNNKYTVPMGYCYTKLDGIRGEIAKIVKEQLQAFIENTLTTEYDTIDIIDTYMPWNRMFEVGLSVNYKRR